MTGTQSSFVWYELMTSDVAAAKAFYSGVVGWKTEDMPMPGMTYTLLRMGEVQVGGMMALPKESTEPGQIGWHELHTSDWPKALDFYGGMFGWAKADGVDMGPMGVYQMFTVGGIQTGGMFNSPAAQAARFWLYYFNVGDIDAAAKRVGDGGGKIMMDPHQVPGGSWIVQADDPQGAAFALVGSHK